jgi:hypothetical protein
MHHNHIIAGNCDRNAAFVCVARTGYGDDGQYGTTAAPPMDKDFYLRQLTSMKDLGYNFIRFHTHSMPTELFEAADELGFLCDPEFAMNCASTHSAVSCFIFHVSLDHVGRI